MNTYQGMNIYDGEDTLMDLMEIHNPCVEMDRQVATTIIQKYARGMIVRNTPDFQVDPYLTFQTTCHWCGECSDDVTFVKSYSLFGCRECASECGDDY